MCLFYINLARSYYTRLCLMFPLLMGLLAIYFHNNLRDFLICSNREEFLRYDLEDFWAPNTYEKEDITNLPRYHPYRILILIVCKYWTKGGQLSHRQALGFYRRDKKIRLSSESAGEIIFWQFRPSSFLSHQQR